MTCITTEEFSAVLRSGQRASADDVAIFHLRPLCEDINVQQDCTRIKEEGLRGIVQCERDLKARQPVLADCMARTHPQVVAAVTKACPAAAARLEELRREAGVIRPTFSRGAVWALGGAVAALGVAIAVSRRR